MKVFAFLLVSASATFSAVADDVLVLDENGRGETGRFRVLDHEGEALGLMVSAEDRFVAAASSARITVGAEEIHVMIDCPVPEGMAPSKSKRNAWAGDGVELFIRPSLESSVYYQYSANAGGVFAARRNTAPEVMDAGWRTAASVSVADATNGFAVAFGIPVSEVFKSPLKPGDAFGINFTRCGKTCGGMSTWAAVGGKFSNIEAFGRAVYGGARAYFARRLADVSDRAGRSSPAVPQLAGMLEKAKAAVDERGGDPSHFAALERMFADVERAIVSATLDGKSVLLFCPEKPWGNRLAPDERSRPLESLRIRAARNSRAVAVFAAANLTDKPFVGQFKVEGVPVGSRVPRDRGHAGRVPLPTANLRFSQGFAIDDRVGRALYDPILPLPMNSVLRLAPKETVPIYLELDTHGLSAETYHAALTLKKAMPGFTDESILLELDIVAADLDEIAVDRAGYDYVGSTFNKGAGSPNIARLLVDRGYNMVYVNPGHLFAKEGKDGAFRVSGFAGLDRHLDAVLAGGLKRERMKLWIYLGLEANHTWNAALDVRGRRCVPGDGKWEKGIQAQVRDIAAHVKARYGIGKDRIYWYPVDEPAGDIEDPTFKSGMSRAYRAAKAIKEEDAANLTMTDPLPVFLESKAIEKALPRLAEVYDVIELYRPKVTEEKKRLVAAQNLKEVWTYSISSKETHPVAYRRDYWENMRDGYREIATFWHMTQAAGSPFDSNDFTTPGRYDDYATLYVDFANDAALLSRRQLAADMGFEDARLVLWLRSRFKGDAAMLAKVEAVVREAAAKGTMSALDSARDALLSLAKTALRVARAPVAFDGGFVL